MESRQLMAALLGAAALVAGAARGGEVTIGLVAQKSGKLASLEGAHEIRRSPYGGWVVATWPFSARVDNTPILDYRDDLLERTLAASKEGGAAEALLKELGVEEPPLVPGISRPSTAKVELHDGKHVLAPGDIRFALERGRLSSDDPRVTIQAGRGLVEVALWPVTLRAFAGERSVAAPMTLAYEGADLLAHLARQPQAERVREPHGAGLPRGLGLPAFGRSRATILPWERPRTSGCLEA